MTGSKKRQSGKGVPEFPALREFFSGYLHQDFRDEYGSAAAAVEAFRRDASGTEIEAVRHEWKAWREKLGKTPVSEIAQAARKFGASWQPQGEDDLDAVETALTAKESNSG
jgi:hypothetical protein